MCMSSMMATMTWGANMLNKKCFSYHSESVIPDITAQQNNALAASSFRWTTAFSILHPVQFLCLIVPKPMLLRRLTNHATRHSKAQAPDVSGARRKWARERAMVTLLRLWQ